MHIIGVIPLFGIQGKLDKDFVRAAAICASSG